MAGSKNILIEKDLLADLIPTQAGDSEVAVCLPYGDKLSVQLIYDVTSFTARAVPSADIVPGDGADESTFEFTAHGFTTGLKVQLTTDDTLPDPLLAATDYYVIVVDANFFRLAASFADAVAGTYIELVDAGEGTQTVTAVALAGASASILLSNDGVNYVLAQTATAITVDGSVLYLLPNVTTKYLKVTKALTAGSVDLKAILILTGDAV